jgi:hypothetical protein
MRSAKLTCQGMLGHGISTDRFHVVPRETRVRKGDFTSFAGTEVRKQCGSNAYRAEEIGV